MNKKPYTLEKWPTNLFVPYHTPRMAIKIAILEVLERFYFTTKLSNMGKRTNQILYGPYSSFKGHIQ